MRLLTIFAFLVATHTLAPASVIVQNVAGTGPLVVSEWNGQRFTTPADSAWNNITFSFYSDYPPATPSAAGTAYLLSQAFSGTPAGLNTSVAGFMAESTGVANGAWDFGMGVVLQSNTTYWIFEDTQVPVGGGTYVGGEATWSSLDAGVSFSSKGGTANFILSGTQIPEPVSIVMMLLGIISLFLFCSSRGHACIFRS